MRFFLLPFHPGLLVTRKTLEHGRCCSPVMPVFACLATDLWVGGLAEVSRKGKGWERFEGRVSLLSYLVVRFCSLSLSQLLSAHKCAPPSIIHIDVAGLENGTTISTACDFPAAKEGIILIHSISAVPRYCFFFLLVCLRY